MATSAELRAEAVFARARGDASQFPDIKSEWLRIAVEYERLANLMDGLARGREGGSSLTSGADAALDRDDRRLHREN